MSLHFDDLTLSQILIVCFLPYLYLFVPCVVFQLVLLLFVFYSEVVVSLILEVQLEYYADPCKDEVKSGAQILSWLRGLAILEVLEY